MRNNKLEEGVKYAKEALAQSPENKSVKKATSFVLFESAKLSLNDKNYNKAREYADSALKLQPKNLQALLLLVNINLDDGKDKQALIVINKIKEVYPKSGIGEQIEGDFLISQKRLKAAVVVYQKAWQANPNGKLGIKLYANMKKINQVEKSISMLEKWKYENPDSASPLMTLGMVYQDAKMSDKAITNYEKLITIDKKNALSLNNLAWLYLDKGDPRALEVATNAYKLSPKTPLIMDTYGWILVKFGKIKQGVEILTAASKAEPKDEDIAKHLTEAKSKL
jgi:tetratricopeptide (TPR) repeat protein